MDFYSSSVVQSLVSITLQPAANLYLSRVKTSMLLCFTESHRITEWTGSGEEPISHISITLRAGSHKWPRYLRCYGEESSFEIWPREDIGWVYLTPKLCFYQLRFLRLLCYER